MNNINNMSIAQFVSRWMDGHVVDVSFADMPHPTFVHIDRYTEVYTDYETFIMYEDLLNTICMDEVTDIDAEYYEGDLHYLFHIKRSYDDYAGGNYNDLIGAED